jgi:hypothetical protein
MFFGGLAELAPGAVPDGGARGAKRGTKFPKPTDLKLRKPKPRRDMSVPVN